MKVLLVEFSIAGHSLTYISKLAESDLYEAVLVVPEKIKTLNCKQYELELQEHKNPLQYFKWIVDLKKIIKKEKAAAKPLQKTQMRSARQGIAVIAANATNINARLTMPKCSSRSSS